jgi:hypothetical protein
MPTAPQETSTRSNKNLEEAAPANAAHRDIAYLLLSTMLFALIFLSILAT